MSDPATQASLLRQVAAEYEEDGYSVTVEPGRAELPSQLWDFRPDMIAIRGQEKVIVEVKLGSIAESAPNLDLLTSRAEFLGFRVDLVYAPEPLTEVLSRSRRRELLNEALMLVRDGHGEAGLLLAASVLEASLRALAGRNRSLLDETFDPKTSKQLVEALQSVGILGEKVGRVLSSFSDARNRVAHGQVLRPTEVNTLQPAIEVLSWLENSNFVSLESMLDWFFLNYEDPVKSVPFDSSEGGYQYFKGEPYDAFDVLANQYPDAPEIALADPVEAIELEGTEWVKRKR